MSVKYQALLFSILALLLAAVLACSPSEAEPADSYNTATEPFQTASEPAVASASVKSAEPMPDSIVTLESEPTPDSALPSFASGSSRGDATTQSVPPSVPEVASIPAMTDQVESAEAVQGATEAMESDGPVPYQPNDSSSRSPEAFPKETQAAQPNSVMAEAQPEPQAADGRQGPTSPMPEPAATAQQFTGPLATVTPATTAKGRGSGPSQPGAVTFQDNPRTPAVATFDDAISTFSLDTDRTSYRLALNWLREGYAVEPDSVRAEEWINAFNYGYSYPASDNEFAITTDVFRHPLEGHKHLARVAFQAPKAQDDAPPSISPWSWTLPVPWRRATV